MSRSYGGRVRLHLVSKWDVVDVLSVRDLLVWTEVAW